MLNTDDITAILKSIHERVSFLETMYMKAPIANNEVHYEKDKKKNFKNTREILK